jgi:phosphatidylglycerophosphatase A
MTARTESPASRGPETDGTGSTPSIPGSKPRLALFVATGCGVGYLPFAPGTFGSLEGLALAFLPAWAFLFLTIMISGAYDGLAGEVSSQGLLDPVAGMHMALAVAVAALGVWSASQVASYERAEDPQYIVIDEVSGQHLTLLLGCGVPIWWRTQEWLAARSPVGLMSMHTALNWKYLLLGFILFRVFDIWKPFPARQAESLSGGWGIMADDWVAGIYAGMGLWIARAAGL